jgi:hypothetical protein
MWQWVHIHISPFINVTQKTLVDYYQEEDGRTIETCRGWEINEPFENSCEDGIPIPLDLK